MSSHNPQNPKAKAHSEEEDNFYLKNNDEIDLIELCSSIWAGKWKIVTAILLCLALAIGYLSVTPKIYILEATLGPPANTDIISIQPSALKNDDEAPSTVFSLVKAYSKSEDELLKFWLSYNGKASLDNEEAENRFLSFYGAFSVKEDTKVGTATLSLQTINPNDDISLMRELPSYINKQVINQLVLRVKPALKVQKERLEAEIVRVRRQYQMSLQDEIARMEEALAIAKAVGIEKTPYDQLANIELKVVDNLYMLGSAALSSQLKVLNERRGSDAFVPRLRDLQNKVEQIEADFALLGAQKNQARAFIVIDPIARPLKPAKPKTALVLALSIVLGGMLGCFWLLIDAILAAVKRRSKSLES